MAMTIAMAIVCVLMMIIIVIAIAFIFVRTCGGTISGDGSRKYDDIVRTKIINVNKTGASGAVSRSFSYETTFVIYYKDGTHIGKTVMNGGREYKEYLKRLEV